MTLFAPAAEAVLVAWYRTQCGGGAATSLPKDPLTWPLLGATRVFIQVTPVDGTPDPENPQRTSLLQTDVWAVRPGSNRPPFDAAAAVAETLMIMFKDMGRVHAALRDAIPEQFADALVQSIWASADPKRLRDDPSGYARYTIDTRMAWAIRSGQDVASGLLLT